MRGRSICAGWEIKQETTSVQPDLSTDNTEDVSIEDLKEKESLENDKVEE